MNMPFRKPDQDTSFSAQSVLLKECRGDHELEWAPGDVLCEKGGLNRPQIITEGWVASLMRLPSNKRIIVQFYLPGDFIANPQRSGSTALIGSSALTKVTTVDAFELLHRAATDGPTSKIDFALKQAGLLEEQRRNAHVLRLGQSVIARTASLFLEFFDRISSAGLSDGMQFDFPLNQETVANHLALSVVHLNRRLTELREGCGALRVRSGKATILNLSLLHLLSTQD